MNHSTTSKLDMAAGHLNAAAGLLVSAEALAQSLRDGTAHNVRAGAATPRVRGLLHYLFVEIDPQLLAACVREAGATWLSADRLYQESLEEGAPRARAWEQLVAGWK